MFEFQRKSLGNSEIITNSRFPSPNLLSPRDPLNHARQMQVYFIQKELRKHLSHSQQGKAFEKHSLKGQGLGKYVDQANGLSGGRRVGGPNVAGFKKFHRKHR